MSEPAPTIAKVVWGPQPDAAALIHQALIARKRADRPEFLRAMLAYTAAAICLEQTDDDAVEALEATARAIRVRDELLRGASPQ